MTRLIQKLMKDDAGFVISAELVLVSTIVVIGMVVGLSEIALNINNELEDVGSAVGSVNQSFRYNGLTGHQGAVAGSTFNDEADLCDGQNDIVGDLPSAENIKY